MKDSIPLPNQHYNLNLFTIAVSKLVDQAPNTFNYALDNVITKISENLSLIAIKDLFPLLMSKKAYIRGEKYDNGEQRLNYYHICQKLIQLLLWNESNPAKDFSIFHYCYKVTISEISEINITIAKHILSIHFNKLNSMKKMLKDNKFDQLKINSLFSGKNGAKDQESNNTAKSDLSPFLQKETYCSATRVNKAMKEAMKEHILELRNNKKYKDFKLPICFDGVNDISALDFIKDYDHSASRNGWSSEKKLEFFPNHLEKEALKWYVSNFSTDQSWKIVKINFMSKYCCT